MKIAGLIASKGPQAIKKVKKVVREGLESSFCEGEKLEAQEFGTLFGEGNEGKVGMIAFLEKRRPEW